MTSLRGKFGASRAAILLAFVIFVSTAGHASAQLYEWTDETGFA